MDYLYGKLNNEVKYREYKGSETTTATVAIDDSSTVSVDVKRVPNELTVTTINGDTYTYDGSEPASFDIRTQVTDRVEEGNNLPVTSDAVKEYVDSKAGALEYVGGEGNFTNINGGVTVKGRLNVDDGIYSPITSDDPNFVPNNKTVDDKITASEQKLIDERIGAFTRTADKLFTDVEGGMTVKGHLNVDGGITSASAPTADSDVANKGYVDDNFVHSVATGSTMAYAKAYVVGIDGNNKVSEVDANGTKAFSIVQRNAQGIVRVGTPVADNDATTKKYVDDADAKKLNLTGGTITGSLAIQGDLAVTGTTTTEKAQTLAVKDSVIVTNADGAELGATLSGIAIRKDGENTYGVMYDPSGDSVKLGLGTLDAENKFTFNDGGTDGKAIATRADSSALTDGNLVKWDDSTKSLVDSGKKTDDFVEKVTDKAVVYATTAEDGSQRAIPWNTAAVPNTVVMRDSNGRTKVADPEEQNDATTKEYVDSALEKKLDTYTGTAFYPVIPIQKRITASDPSAGYTQAWEQMSVEATNNTVAKRTAKGTLATATPISDKDATPKKYVEDNFVAKVTTTSGFNLAYVAKNNGTQAMFGIATSPSGGTIAQRKQNGGALEVGTPVAVNDATTKKYVDDGFVPKGDPDSYSILYGRGSDGAERQFKFGYTVAAPFPAYVDDNGNSGELFNGHYCFLPCDTDSTNGPTTQAVNLGYANAHYVAKTTQTNVVYGTGNNGDAEYTHFAYNPVAWNITKFDGTGCLRTNDPTGDDGRQCVNKQFADGHYLAKRSETTQRTQAYVKNENGTQSMYDIAMYHHANTIAVRGEGGVLKVGTPVGVNDATTKAYVDGGFVKSVAGTKNEPVAYIRSGDGTDKTLAIVHNLNGSTNNGEFTLVQRGIGGIVKVGTPVGVNDATTKAYVDNLNTITITAGA